MKKWFEQDVRAIFSIITHFVGGAICWIAYNFISILYPTLQKADGPFDRSSADQGMV